MASDAVTLLIWDPLLAASDLEAHAAGSSCLQPAKPLPTTSLSSSLFLGPECRGEGPSLHVTLLAWAIAQSGEICLAPVPVSL